MFKLAHNGNILMDVKSTSPPSAAFIIEALEKSPYADCEIDHDAINAYFDSDFPESQIVVAKQCDAEFTVTLTDDKMQAYGKLVTAKGGKKISLDDAKKVIVKAGVSRGYKQAYLEQILSKQFELSPGEEASGLIAQGRPPQDGQAAKLLPHVQTLKERLKQPKLREDGTVDMRDFGKLASVAPGDLLATQKPATPGKEGFTVTGDTIEAKAGESFQLTPGEGTEINPNNPLELVATIAGCPSDIANGMRVDDVFTIADVNVKSGHVDFNGSVIVTHNVDPGMKVTAQGDITVMGTVESGQLVAGGSIEVKGGVIGHLDHQNNDQGLTCQLIAKGNIDIAHGQYTYLEGDNVFISKQSNHCDIKANKLIQVGTGEHPNGKLIGGTIIDAQMVVAGEIGSESGAKMMVYLARKGLKITEDTDQLFKEVAATNESLDQLQQAIEKAELVKDNEKKQQLKTKIGATQMHYCQQAEQLEKQLSQLEQELHALLEGTKLSANKALHSGVEIHIFDRVQKTTRSYPPCTATLQENKVKIDFKTAGQ
ncbi:MULTISPECIES: FapA family protein [unclassified Pseudoalteromonas]|uniref:FapA family protein n=1 Tax=unclassified Pseudoalteromonas TaxID=194690 RepID=UPI0030153AE7